MSEDPAENVLGNIIPGMAHVTGIVDCRTAIIPCDVLASEWYKGNFCPCERVVHFQLGFRFQWLRHMPGRLLVSSSHTIHGRLWDGHLGMVACRVRADESVRNECEGGSVPGK